MTTNQIHRSQIMKKYSLLSMAFIAIIIAFAGCSVPESANPNDGWITYEVRQEMPFDEAWNIVVEGILTRGYQFETIAKDDGYIKTEWLQEYVESLGVEVRTRVSVKFTYGRRTIRMKVDEIYLDGFKTPGVDIPRVSDLKLEMRDRLL
jgi:hypothetical protein